MIRAWIDSSRIALDALPEPAPPQRSEVALLDRQQAFGYTQEDLKFFLAPMATSAAFMARNGAIGARPAANRSTKSTA